MKTVFPVLLALLAGGTASANIPLLNYKCPTGIAMHADEGGPVYINGKEASLKKFNDNYYEAKSGPTTISIARSPDGSTSVSYTGAHGANGVCTAESSGGDEQEPSGPRGGLPLLNASCPGGISVHVDEGGPVYINGKQASLKKFNDNYYEAKGGGTTISITFKPDGTPDVSYTGQHGANGVCRAH